MGVIFCLFFEVKCKKNAGGVWSAQRDRVVACGWGGGYEAPPG